MINPLLRLLLFVAVIALAWSGQCLANPPSTAQAIADNSARKASDFRPFRYCSSRSITGNQPRCSSVSALLNRSCPPAISRFIVTIAVDSVQRHSSRAFSHVSKEVGKGFHPPWTYSDSSASVAIPAIHGWVCTPLNHGSITAECTRDSSVTRMPVNCASITIRLPEKASARDCMSAAKTAGCRNVFCSAVASALPFCGLTVTEGFHSVQNHKTAEPLSCQIDKTRHCSSSYAAREKRRQAGELVRRFGSDPSRNTDYTERVPQNGRSSEVV